MNDVNKSKKMDKKLSIYKYGWYEFDSDMNKLVKEILYDKKLKYVVGIPRGGLPIAVSLSHLTNLECLSGFDVNKLSSSFTTKELLIVDDISDSGRTLRLVSNLNFKTATLFTRTTSVTPPTYTVNVLDDRRWVLFPWETIKDAF